MKYRLILTKRFEKDVKRCVKRGLPMEMTMFAILKMLRMRR